ncbi:uncharacterized protein [Littorina saxatilis]
MAYRQKRGRRTWQPINTDFEMLDCSKKGKPKKMSLPWKPGRPTLDDLDFPEQTESFKDAIPTLSVGTEPTPGSSLQSDESGIQGFMEIDSKEVTLSAHSQRKAVEEDRWCELRGSLLQTRLESLCPVQICSHCQKRQTDIIRCWDCGPMVFLCHNCSSNIHRTVMFHKPYIWKEDKMYWPVQEVPHLKQLPRHICDNVSTIDIVVFDAHGVSQDVRMDICPDEGVAVTMLQYGLWPATPCNPRTAFSLQLLELCVCMQLHGSLSVQAFANSIQELDLLMGIKTAAKTKPDLYRNLIGAINEYRYHRTQVTREGRLADVDVHSCGVCEEDRSRSVLSLDGNFALVHKQRSGNYQTPRHKDGFFVKDDEVSEFVKQWTANASSKDCSDCSQFQAGDAIRSKNKTKKLDVTGVFGSVCQHEFPGLMLNMKQGEIMAYPSLLLSKLPQRTSDLREKQQLIMYDVGCKLHKHLKNRMSNLVEQFRFSVPAFHRFAHNMPCQLTYGQRCTVGAGLCDGEGMERVWSYLRKFAPASKQMAMGSREDLLNDALFAYSRKSFSRLGKKLLRQMETAARMKQRSQSDFQGIEQELKGHSDIAGTSKDWLTALQKDCTSQPSVRGDAKLTLREEYAYTIVQVAEKRAELQTSESENTKEKLSADIERLLIQAHKLQRRCRLDRPLDAKDASTKNAAVEAKAKFVRTSLSTALTLSKERQFLNHLRAKYADGQSVASRIGKQLKINSQNLAKASDNLASYGCEVSSKDLKDLDHPVYVQLQASGLNHLQQKAALAYADFERACEGEEATKKDMGLFLTCLAKKEKKLDMLICDVPLSSDQYGELHILCARRIALEQLHETCATDFAKHIAINSWVYSKSHLLETLSASSLEPTFDLQECDLVECDEVEDSSDDDM